MSNAIQDYTVNHESKGNYKAKNPTSSASGKYQMIKRTRQAYAKRLGLTDAESMTPEGQEATYKAFTADNRKQLERAGVEITPGNMYGAHQQGAGTYAKIYHNKPTDASRKTMYDNLPKSLQKGLDPKDYAAVRKVWMNKYVTKGNGGASAAAGNAGGTEAIPENAASLGYDDPSLSEGIKNVPFAPATNELNSIAPIELNQPKLMGLGEIQVNQPLQQAQHPMAMATGFGSTGQQGFGATTPVAAAPEAEFQAYKQGLGLGLY